MSGDGSHHEDLLPEGTAPPQAMGYGVPREGSGWPPGDAVIREVMKRCQASEVLRVIAELEAKVAGMPIAGRFSATNEPRWFMQAREPNPWLTGVPESEAKRRQILIHLTQVRRKILDAFACLGEIVLDMEATQMNFATGEVESQGAGTPPENTFGYAQPTIE